MAKVKFMDSLTPANILLPTAVLVCGSFVAAVVNRNFLTPYFYPNGRPLPGFKGKKDSHGTSSSSSSDDSTADHETSSSSSSTSSSSAVSHATSNSSAHRALQAGQKPLEFPPPAQAFWWPVFGHLFYIVSLNLRVKGMDDQVEIINREDRKLREQGKEGWEAISIAGQKIQVVNHEMVMILNPEDVKYVTQTNVKNYEMGELRKKVAYHLLGEGIFASDDAPWKEKRTTAKPSFQNTRLEQMLPVFQHHADSLITLIKTRSSSFTNSVEVQDLFMCYTLDCSGEILFNHPIGSLHNQIPFQEAFDYLQFATSKMTGNPFWKFFPNKMDHYMAICEGFVMDIIKKARSDPNLDSRVDLLAQVMASKDENGNPYALNTTYLRDTLMNFLIAGRDTTAATLTWMFYELAKHPEVQQKAYEEIMRSFPDSYPSTLDEIRSLKYLKDVVNEALRLYPPVARVLRAARGDDILPSGYGIKAGNNVSYSPYIIHRLERIWGPDALVFDPDRWSDERTKSISSFDFLPFHGGPRRCLGFDLAYNEAKMAALAIIRKYTVSLDESHSVIAVSPITLAADTGIKIFFKERVNPMTPA